MELVIGADGGVRALYSEEIDLSTLGPLSITRASHVEPDSSGRWLADLSPLGGPLLGPFTCRSAALDAEQKWIETNWLSVNECMSGLTTHDYQPAPTQSRERSECPRTNQMAEQATWRRAT